jgi:hypothetical protein
LNQADDRRDVHAIGAMTAVNVRGRNARARKLTPINARAGGAR